MLNKDRDFPVFRETYTSPKESGKNYAKLLFVEVFSYGKISVNELLYLHLEYSLIDEQTEEVISTIMLLDRYFNSREGVAAWTSSVVQLDTELRFIAQFEKDIFHFAGYD